MSTPSPASVASLLADDAARVRRGAWRKYLDSLNDPQAVADAKGAAALRVAAGALGKSAADVDADLRVLAAVRKHRERIARAVGSKAAMAEAFAVARAYDAETQHILEERRGGYRRLHHVYENISLTRVRAGDSVREINRLIAQNPELLAGEQPAVAVD